ncbi:hypothetical protein ACFLX8_03600 [Chloroflexota bacterium]
MRKLVPIDDSNFGQIVLPAKRAVLVLSLEFQDNLMFAYYEMQSMPGWD